MVRAYIQRNKTGWRALYYWLMVSAGNRAGKTMAVAIIIMHSCIYKMGSPPPRDESDHALDQWRRRPYLWFHFAIQQEIAELVFQEIVMLLSGTHPAQPDGLCPLAEEAGGATNVATWAAKYNGDYRWVVFNPLFGGAEVHFRTTSEQALGSLGRDMHGISFDEVGFERRLPFIVNEVLHTRRLGTGGQLILISTPTEGINDFSDLWYTGDPESPDRKPGRFSMRMSTRDNVGYGLHADVFDELVADMPEALVPQNIEGFFIQGRQMYFNAGSADLAFVDDLPEMSPAVSGGVYLQGVDPALRADATWSLVFRLGETAAGEPTLTGVRASRIRGRQTTPAIVNLALDARNAYSLAPSMVPGHPQRISQPGSYCMTALDATGFGGKMFKEALDLEVDNVVAIEFGGTSQKKRKLLGDLRTMIDSGRLIMPRTGIWLAVRRQVLGYKLDDRSIEQDAVMALCCVVALVRRASLSTEDAVPFDYNDFALPRGLA
jgi:hypothetical protein